MIRTSTYLLLLLTRLTHAQPAARALEFIENRGQWDVRARYAAQVGPGARLFVEATGLTYALTAGLPDHGPPAAAPRASVLKAHALRVEFVQPGPDARLTAPEAPATTCAGPMRRTGPAACALGPSCATRRCGRASTWC